MKLAYVCYRHLNPQLPFEQKNSKDSIPRLCACTDVTNWPVGLALKDKEVISQVLFVVAPVGFIMDVFRHIIVVVLE